MSCVFPVILGSVRRDRIGIRAARYICAELERRGHHPHLVDAGALKLPLVDRMYKEHEPGQAPAVLEELASLYRRADGILLISAEYNNSPPPALLNTLDYFLEEYYFRPSAICCYSSGRFGGVRAAMQLRMTTAELGMPSIPSLLPMPALQNAIAEDGTLLDPALGRTTARFLDELEWYARAFGAERARGTPY